MKLARLDVKDFRSIVSASLPLAHVNFILGGNFAGKTSVLLAMKELLLASIPRSRVAAGAKSTKVELQIYGPYAPVTIAMTRYSSRAETPKVNGTPMPKESWLRALPNHLGVTAKVLAAVLDSGEFMRSSSEAQAGLILDAAGVDYSWDDAEAAFLEWARDNGVTHFPLTKHLSRQRLSGLALLEAIQKDAYRKRTEANRAAAELEPAPVPPDDVVQYARSERLARQLREEQTALRDRLPRLQQRLSWAEDLSGLDAARADLEAARAVDPEAMAADARAADEDWNEAERKVAETRKTALPLLDAELALGGGACPFKVKCKLPEWDPEAWDGVQSAAEGARKDLERAQEKLAGLRKPDPGAHARARAARDTLARLEERVSTLERVAQSLGAVDVPSLSLEVEQVSGRLQEVVRLLNLLSVHERAVARHKGLIDAQAKAKARADELDTIVKAFDKGIRFKLVDDVIARFVAPMRAALSLFAGKGFDYKALGGENFRMFPVRRGIEVAFSDLSESEQLLYTVSAQHALSDMSGAGILIVDAMDTLGGPVRQRFIRGLYKAAESYDTVVVASTTGEISPETSPLRNRERFPTTRLFLVEGGHVEPLKQLAPAELQALKA